jgi:hypothetical protein
MIILHIPKDGNCLFRSLASFFQSPDIDHHLIRKMLVHYIYQHPESFKTDILSEGYRSVEEYCQHMSHPRTWGDGTCLQCFTMLFNVNVWLCYAGGSNCAGPPTLISAHKEGAPNLALLLTNNHYDRILAWE